jgi:hypothetical protein
MTRAGRAWVILFMALAVALAVCVGRRLATSPLVVCPDQPERLRAMVTEDEW